MAVRNPVRVFTAQLTTVASASAYTVPANSKFTFSAASVNNITAAGVTFTAQITPSGGSAFVFYSGMNIPAASAAPTQLPGLVGHTLEAGDKIEMSAGSNTALNVILSGYLQQ